MAPAAEPLKMSGCLAWKASWVSPWFGDQRPLARAEECEMWRWADKNEYSILRTSLGCDLQLPGEELCSQYGHLHGALQCLPCKYLPHTLAMLLMPLLYMLPKPHLSRESRMIVIQKDNKTAELLRSSRTNRKALRLLNSWCRSSIKAVSVSNPAQNPGKWV